MEVDGVRIEVTVGDIAAMRVDAVVNAANNHLWMGSGVAGAIKRAGGGNIETEAMSKGPLAVGESVVTGGGSLDARYVIHAVVMGQDLVTSGEAIRRATRSSLEQALVLGIGSVALPAFGTGVGGFPPGEAAAVMTSETVAFVHDRKPGALDRIIFVLFSDHLQNKFEEALTEVQI